MSELSLHLPPPRPSLTLRTRLSPQTPKRNMKLQICVANAYAAQASRGKACCNLEGTGALLGFGLLQKPEERFPSGSRDLGPASPQPLAFMPG